MQNIFDTHFHLSEDVDLNELVNRAQQAGVDYLFVAGASPERVHHMVASIQDYPCLFAAVGVHPHAAEKYDGRIEPYRQFFNDPKIKAVGEVGIDYHYDFAAPEVQRQVFAEFLGLAYELRKPVVVHCRKAAEDCHELLREHLQGEVPFVVHCFTETLEWARRFLDLGAYLSFNGIMTFKNAQEIRDVMRAVPRERIFFETDSPYLAPVPFRGKPNEPAYMPHIVTRAAEELDMDVQALIDLSTANAMRFYNIGASN